MKVKNIALFLILGAAAFAGCGKKDAPVPALPEPEPGESYLIQLQTRDSVLIADQLRYGFRVEGIIDGNPFQPLPEKPALPGVRFLGEWQVDTLETRSEGGLEVHDLDVHLRLTSFDEGSYELPELGAVVGCYDGGSDTLRFGSRTLEVRNCPVDTAKFAPGVLDIPSTALIRYPWTKKEIWTVTGLSAGGLVLLALLVLLILWLIRRYRRKLLPPVQEPAHIRALRKIDAYRDSAWWKPERQKGFYSGITDSLKEYIGDRYGFDAPEMTSGEVLHHLKTRTDLDKDLRAGLGHLFEVADFVKFAKHTVDDAENASVVPFATNFVTATWQQAIEAEAENKKKEAEQ
ncbi:MAG: hypothetical protein IKR96_06860 [Bacteroidales bacterium]|nr:hypothetical protein [Bacteroidales bacterium]